MSRTIVNHNAQAWADDYLALSNKCMAHASEIETSGTAHPLHWHIYGQLQSIGRLAFDIQACILRANNTNKESEMQDITFTPLTSHGLAEACDLLDDRIVAIDREIELDPLSVHLQNVKTALRNAITSINVADEQIALFHQRREDSAAVYAISDAINSTFEHESNAGPARGMLRDIASFGPQILKAIRDAGYQVTPLG